MFWQLPLDVPPRPSFNTEAALSLRAASRRCSRTPPEGCGGSQHPVPLGLRGQAEPRPPAPALQPSSPPASGLFRGSRPQHGNETGTPAPSSSSLPPFYGRSPPSPARGRPGPPPRPDPSRSSTAPRGAPPRHPPAGPAAPRPHSALQPPRLGGERGCEGVLGCRR